MMDPEKTYPQAYSNRYEVSLTNLFNKEPQEYSDKMERKELIIILRK